MSSGDSKYKECETVQLCHIPESFKKINSERLSEFTRSFLELYSGIIPGTKLYNFPHLNLTATVQLKALVSNFWKN